MKREIGFYWCLWAGKWEVCQWIGTEWLMAGYSLHEGSYYDLHFEKIDERIIINPNE